MGKTSLLIFKKDCMGCHACEVACKQEHALGVGPRLIRVKENAAEFIPVYCHHCAKAPCVDACPVDAIVRDESGIVLIDDTLCIGCRDCLEACPFGAMQFDDEADVAVKCDLCIDRIEDNDQPACVKACATQCIFWGDTKALHDRVNNHL
jgi:Fe-S-cluster-containing dehydrogenase component